MKRCWGRARIDVQVQVQRRYGAARDQFVRPRHRLRRRGSTRCSTGRVGCVRVRRVVRFGNGGVDHGAALGSCPARDGPRAVGYACSTLRKARVDAGGACVGRDLGRERVACDVGRSGRPRRCRRLGQRQLRVGRRSRACGCRGGRRRCACGRLRASARAARRGLLVRGRRGHSGRLGRIIGPLRTTQHQHAHGDQVHYQQRDGRSRPKGWSSASRQRWGLRPARAPSGAAARAPICAARRG